MTQLPLSDSDKSALWRVSPTTVVPKGATICTATSFFKEFTINCAGFKREFNDVNRAAAFLEMPGSDLEELFSVEGHILILIRHKDGHWHSSTVEKKHA